MRFWTGESIKELKENQVFVFGSNPSGRHGAGAAKAAMSFGAKYGVGRGLQGQTYALITKNLEAGYTEKATGITYTKEGYQSVSKEQISKNIDELYECAKQNPDKFFIVVYKNETWPNGSPKKSLNGYTGEEMFEMFAKGKDVPANIILHDSFKPLAKALLAKKEEPQEQADNQFTFFWKSKSVFSQWHPSIFTYKDITFTSAEQFMMYSKAKLFGDEEVAQKIMDKNNHPLVQDFINGKVGVYDIIDDYKTLRMWDTIQKEIKDLGKSAKGFDNDIWEAKREPIISVASREKFKQNPDMKHKLMVTNGTTLVEASPYDKIYGIGMTEDDPAAKDPSKWKGLNLLGKVLTNTRTNFEQELKTKHKMKL